MPKLASWEAYLHEYPVGDEALERNVAAHHRRRVENGPANFSRPNGIRWIVVLDDEDTDFFASAWRTVFVGQLDLVPLGGGLDSTTFENEVEGAERGQSPAAVPRGSEMARGTAGKATSVRISRMGETRTLVGDRASGSNSDWVNVVPASAGLAEFDPIGSRRTQAITAAVWLIALAAFSWAGRRFG